jgi:hypothetical protein
MMLSRLSEAQLTDEVRKVSNSVFGRPCQLEVAAAIAALDTNSTIDDIYMKTRERAEEAGLDSPKVGAVRKSVDRLATARALVEFPAQRPGTPSYFNPNSDSAFWDLALELHA